MSAPLSLGRLSEIRAREQAVSGSPDVAETRARLVAAAVACLDALGAHCRSHEEGRGPLFQANQQARGAFANEVRNTGPYRLATIIMGLDGLPALLDEVERLRGERDALREALARFGQHRDGCEKAPRVIDGIVYGAALPPKPCACGLDAAREVQP